MARGGNRTLSMRRELETDLRQLPGSAPLLIAKLRRMGLRGCRTNAGRCVMARYFEWKFPGWHFEVMPRHQGGELHVYLYRQNVPCLIFAVPLPPAILDVVDLFDRGRLPEFDRDLPAKVVSAGPA